MEKSIIIEKFSEALLSKFTSEATINTYYAIGCKFINHKHNDAIDRLTKEYLSKYLLTIKKNLSVASYNQYMSVIKILYRDILNQPHKVSKFHPIKQERKLKILFSDDEIKNALSKINNVKHKAIILTLYSTGIRMSELLDIKISDVDGVNNRILIRNGKGNKSRFVPLNNHLIDYLRLYYKAYKPKTYLFEGDNGKYSKSSVNKVIKKHVGEIYHAHYFRHNFIKRSVKPTDADRLGGM